MGKSKRIGGLYYVTVAELDEFKQVPVIESVSFVYDFETEGLTEE